MSASESGDKFSEDNLFYDGASRIVHAEAAHLRAWRGREPRVGLALSGGGIRSASFCLGVLQALAYRRALPQVDYLSTVSGGGYIGVSLSFLLHQSSQGTVPADVKDVPKFDVSRENFPYVSYPMVGVGGAASEAPGVPAPEHLRQHENFKGRLLRRLRQSANYLVPGKGLTLLSLTGVVLRNLTSSLLVHVALLVVLFQVLLLKGWFTFALHPQPASSAAPAEVLNLPAGNPVLRLAGWVFGVYGLLSVLYIVFTRASARMERRGRRSSYGVRRGYEVAVHYLFVVCLACLVLGGLPWLYELLAGLHLTHLQGWLQWLNKDDKSNPVAAGVVATLVGIIGNVWGFVQSRSRDTHRIPTGLLLGAGSVLLALGLLLLVYMLTGWLHVNHVLAGDMAHFVPGVERGVFVFGGDTGIFVLAGCVLVLFGWWPEANYLSLHRYYRDRLMDLFLPDLQVVRADMLTSTRNTPLQASFVAGFVASVKALRQRGAHLQPGDATLLGDLCRSAGESDAGSKLLRGPYPLINANVVLTASQHPRYRPRGGDNFLFSPLFCGSRATGWTDTDRTPGSGFTLATAMAISGAAVNPNAGTGGQGVTRQPVLSVLMGLLNLRLGYWATNPRYLEPDGSKKRPSWRKPNPIYPGLFESFGRFNLNEHERFSLLTDGGHFENLGLYELVRRRLKLIIVCDATADPDFKFTDLANAIQKVRADFGAIIDISDAQLATLMPQADDATRKGGAGSGSAARSYLIAPIRYSQRLGHSPDSEREVGTLILLKATAFQGTPADVFSYRREHPEFPNQSTLDQFYDEKQFDSYRELGYITAHHMLKEFEASGPELGEQYQTPKGYRAPTKYQVARLLFGERGAEPASRPATQTATPEGSESWVIVVER